MPSIDIYHATVKRGKMSFSIYLPIFLAGFFVFFNYLYSVSYAKTVKDTSSLCLECHPKAEDLVRKSVVHLPVKEGKCTACHNPHASKHKSLLGYRAAELCYNCHAAKKGFAGTVVHEPVAEGNCLFCHDAHSTDIGGLLTKAGREICYACHLKEVIVAKENVHPEVKMGNCISCHDPHTSDREGLLKKDRKDLCSGCHKGAGEVFIKAHLGYKVNGTDCLGCHSPHSSDKKGILKASLHKPFQENKCTSCHPPASSSVIEKGIQLCLDCHKDSMIGFNKINNHLTGGIGDNPCGSCHNPHASDEKYLMRDKEHRVCYKCHSDTNTYVAKSEHKHPKIGVCSDCHVSHGSNNQFFLAKGSDTCSQEVCHPTQGRFTHPVGSKIIDPRSKSPMDCVTCHNPMGSPESAILRFEKDKELCVQCHQV